MNFQGNYKFLIYDFRDEESVHESAVESGSEEECWFLVQVEVLDSSATVLHGS